MEEEKTLGSTLLWASTAGLENCIAYLRRSDHHFWTLSSGLALGFYFGFRIGVVSQKARDLLASIAYMNAVGCENPYYNPQIEAFHVEAPQQLQENEVMIEVMAGTLDYIDLRIARGYGSGLREQVNKYNLNYNGSKVVLGRDGSGIVTQVGNQVQDLAPGDKVWFAIPHCLQGSLSNYIVLQLDYVKKMPRSLDFAVAAAVPSTLMVAWDILVSQGNIRPDKKANTGSKVLICGGLRPTELMCLQLAKFWGCKVTVLSPDYTHETWRQFGAHQALDITDLRGAKACQQFDVVINTGGPLMQDICRSLASKTVISTLVSPTNDLRTESFSLLNQLTYSIYAGLVSFFRANLLGSSQSQLSRYQLRPELLDAFSDLIEVKGFEYQDITERVFDSNNATLAARCLAAGGQQGKLVIKLRPFKKICPISTHLQCH